MSKRLRRHVPAWASQADRTCSEDLQSCFCRELWGHTRTWFSPTHKRPVPQASEITGSVSQHICDLTYGGKKITTSLLRASYDYLCKITFGLNKCVNNNMYYRIYGWKYELWWVSWNVQSHTKAVYRSPTQTHMHTHMRAHTQTHAHAHTEAMR